MLLIREIGTDQTTASELNKISVNGEIFTLTTSNLARSIKQKIRKENTLGGLQVLVPRVGGKLFSQMRGTPFEAILLYFTLERCLDDENV